MTALLSERQKKAADLAREIGKLDGVWVVSPLPLDDSARLRFQVLDSCRNEVVQLLRDWGWQPTFRSVLPRVSYTGLQGAGVYEIDIPRDRTPVQDDRPRGEIATREKLAAEKAHLVAMYKSIYGK
jgi:hypothetical protein